MTDIYRGECLLLGWGESHRDGRYVRLQLDEEGSGNPFKGLKTGPNGQRFAVVIRILNDDQTVSGAVQVSVQAESAVSEDAGGRAPGPTPIPAPSPKRKWEDMKPSQQAGMLCDDGKFQAWLMRYYPAGWDEMSKANGSADATTIAAQLVRSICGISSRSLLDAEGSKQRRIWGGVLASYRATQQFQAHEADR